MLLCSTCRHAAMALIDNSIYCVPRKAWVAECSNCGYFETLNAYIPTTTVYTEEGKMLAKYEYIAFITEKAGSNEPDGKGRKEELLLESSEVAAKPPTRESLIWKHRVTMEKLGLKPEDVRFEVREFKGNV